MAVLAAAVWVAYLHALDTPFYLDDYSSIHENAAIRDGPDLAALWRYHPLRFVTYLTFALNYRFTRLDPAPFHATNVFIHMLVVLAVWGFARAILRTPRLSDSTTGPQRDWLPLIAASVFALHPMHTQAVTYVVQRLASLAALFYVAAMTAFLYARMAKHPARRVLWWTACAVLTGLTFFTKQNGATLPAALLLLEAAFFRHGLRFLPKVAAIGIASVAGIWLILAVAYGESPLSLSALDALTRQSTTVSRTQYLATQAGVLWTYLRLFAWPVGLHLDRAQALAGGLVQGTVLLALAGHVMVVGAAVWGWRRSPLASFAVLFYYLAHLVESSALPIWELAFEYRAYLPNVGLCLLSGWALSAVLPRLTGDYRVTVVTACLWTFGLGVLTWQQNALWRDPVAMWRENVRLAPTKPRAWSNLGKHLVEAGRPAEAEAALREAVQLRASGYPSAGVNALLDVVNLAEALRMQERPAEALALLDENAGAADVPAVRPRFLLARGNALMAQGAVAEAESLFREVLASEPHNVTARVNLAGALAGAGRFREAEGLLAAAAADLPNDPLIRVNRMLVSVGRLVEVARVYRLEGREALAVDTLQAALRILEDVRRENPGDARALAAAEKILRSLGRPTNPHAPLEPQSP